MPATTTVSFQGRQSISTTILTNGALTGGTSWSVAGGFALAADAATYTHAGGTGTLTQTSAAMVEPITARNVYQLTYTISATTLDGTVTLTTAAANPALTLPTTDGLHVTYFYSADAPGDFVISVTSTSGAFTIDTLALKTVTFEDVGFNNVILNGKLKPSGSDNGLSFNTTGDATLDGSLTLGTDLAVAQGGTGASTAENARINLGSIGILSTTTGIDGKTIATTNLYTVPSGKTAVITDAIVRVTTADTITVVGTAGIGIAAGEADIFAAAALTGLDTTTECFRFSNALSTYATGAATNVIKLGIDVGYTATTATLAVDLIGYLL